MIVFAMTFAETRGLAFAVGWLVVIALATLFWLFAKIAKRKPQGFLARLSRKFSARISNLLDWWQ
jgi:hypothetical protein